MQINHQTEDQNKIQLKQAHTNFLSTLECVALLNNLRDDLGRKLDYVLCESTENRIDDSQIRMKLVEIKSLRDTIKYIENEKSIIRPRK